ncbi:hypothetical protein BC830DRAFT_1232412 [Chytriomyces sp. MP71]|nr:hypothetical protein BC830DRAFT_1232412 [Chytriomyces sp. MP71]
MGSDNSEAKPVQAGNGSGSGGVRSGQKKKSEPSESAGSVSASTATSNTATTSTSATTPNRRRGSKNNQRKGKTTPSPATHSNPTSNPDDFPATITTANATKNGTTQQLLFLQTNSSQSLLQAQTQESRKKGSAKKKKAHDSSIVLAKQEALQSANNSTNSTPRQRRMSAPSVPPASILAENYGKNVLSTTRKSVTNPPPASKNIPMGASQQQSQPSVSLSHNSISQLSSSFQDRLYAGANFQNAPSASDLPIPVFPATAASGRNSTSADATVVATTASPSPPRQQALTGTTPSPSPSLARSYEPVSGFLPVSVNSSGYQAPARGSYSTPSHTYAQPLPNQQSAGSLPRVLVPGKGEEEAIFEMDEDEESSLMPRGARPPPRPPLFSQQPPQPQQQQQGTGTGMYAGAPFLQASPFYVPPGPFGGPPPPPLGHAFPGSVRQQAAGGYQGMMMGVPPPLLQSHPMGSGLYVGTGMGYSVPPIPHGQAPMPMSLPISGPSLPQQLARTTTPQNKHLGEMAMNLKSILKIQQ